MDKDTALTDALHLAYEREEPYRALSMPVYHTASYDFQTAEAMEEAFCGRSADYVYSRIANPTVQYFEQRVQKMTGALGVMAFNSGMAAISNALVAVAQSGTNIVTSHHLFGNTYGLMRDTLRSFGVEMRCCDLTDVEAVRANVDEQTCALFVEIITNPQMEVADLSALSTVCRERHVPLMADTTLVPFTAFDAKAFGVDIEVLSTTKYVSGGGTSLGGLIIDYGTFDWQHSPKLSAYVSRFGNDKAFTGRLRCEIARNLGASLNPHAAYMQTLGLETLALRYERQATTCLTLARRLQTLPDIVSVNYTGLSDNPFYEISTKQFGALAGAMLTFELRSRAACYKLINHLKCFRRATNLFENKSLAIHPASTIFGNFTPEARQAMNVYDTTIRLSIGMEDAETLFEDIVQALRYADAS